MNVEVRRERTPTEHDLGYDRWRVRGTKPACAACKRSWFDHLGDGTCLFPRMPNTSYEPEEGE